MIDLYNFDKKECNSKEDFMKLFKREFNKRIARIKKAEEYYNAATTTDEDICKTLDEFLKIYDELIRLGNDFEKILGYKLSYEIMTDGFVE